MVKCKKLLALILALVLVVSLGAVALAQEEAEGEATTETAAETEAATEEATEEAAEAGYVEITPIAGEVTAVPVILADLISQIHQIEGTLVTVPEPLVTEVSGGVLSQPDAVRSINAALAQAEDQSALVAVATWRNPASITAADMAVLANTAGDTPLIVNADALPFISSDVDVRIVFAPAMATQDIQLFGTTRSVTARIVGQLFERAHGGTASVVSLAQQGEFGMEVRVAARLDESFAADAVYFYTYDAEANTFTQFTPSFIWLDSTGFLHFTTTVGGEIVVSDVNLAPPAPPAPAPAPAPVAPAPVADEVEADEEDDADEEEEDEEEEDEEA